jgi:hypothetical protein
MKPRTLESGTLLATVGLWLAALWWHIGGGIPRWSLYAMAPLVVLVGWQVERRRARRVDADDPLRPWRTCHAVRNLTWSAAPEGQGALELELVTSREDTGPGVMLRFHGVRMLGANVELVYGPRFDFLIAQRFWDRPTRQWRLQVQDRSGTGIAFVCDSIAEVRDGSELQR